MRAHFEAHFKKQGIRFAASIEAQTWGQVVHHHQIEKEENFWESTSHCSHYSYEQEKCDQEKSQFGDSCVSYDDEHSSLFVALEKTEIGCSVMTLEDKEEKKCSSITRSKPLKNVVKAATKTSTKKHVLITKGSSSCNTKTSIDTTREKVLKPKGIAKSIASQAPILKKTQCLTPLVATREKRTTSNSFSFRSNERAEKRKEEKVEVVRKDLNLKEKPMPKSTQARPPHISIGQAKARDVAQEHSSKGSCDRSLVNGPAKSKVNIHRQRDDLDKSLNGILPKSSDQTARNNVSRRSLAVRRSAVEVSL